MKKENMFPKYIALLIVASAVVIQLTEAGCGGSRPSCSSDDDCPNGWVCLQMDQPGVKKCWNCTCSEKNQCGIMNGRLHCNCSQTGGYYGTFCQCPPSIQESCSDEFSVYGICGVLSLDQFELLDDRILNSDSDLNPVYQSFGSSISECEAKCIQLGCHVFNYGQNGGTCDVYSSADTMPFSKIINKVIVEEDFTIHIRKCIDCSSGDK